MLWSGAVLYLLLAAAASAGAAGDVAVKADTTPAWPSVVLARKAIGLDRPTSITNAGDGSNRLFVTEQKGRIILLKDFTIQKASFLDITNRVSCCGERGLLSVVFPKGYAKKRYFYVNYTDKSGDTVVARYRLTSGIDAADPKSEEVILTVKQPYANHNGGQLAFGPDGFLYIGMGDGGSGGDPHGYAQDPGSHLGKMLRIDVESGGKPYALPPGNPYLNRTGYRPEIWALGLRNPWRFSFDPKTGDLYIADVGQNRYEEVDVQPVESKGGENYGWNIMEGMHCFKSPSCDKAGLAMPIVEYGHDKGCSVTGGMAYRATEYPALQGTYLYSDFCSGRIWGLRRKNDGWQHTELMNSGRAVSTFGVDEQRNIYLADYNEGALYKIEALPSGQ
jgi:glucose/arabinose dehydrogenase